MCAAFKANLTTAGVAVHESHTQETAWYEDGS